MASLNKVQLIGNLGKDPEVRHTNDGKPIVSMTLATTESWRDRSSGERKEKTEWHRIVIFNEGLAKVAEQYLKKGSQVYIEGQLQTRKWVNKEGADQYSTEIVLQNFRGELVMLGSRSNDDNERPEQRSSSSSRATSKPTVRKTIDEDLNDEVPF